ncbi:MAG: hypothetical protein IH889_02725 [Planctomycetes bacterium]|nr:hypothetical protein [Planctomycetota bacterium]
MPLLKEGAYKTFKRMAEENPPGSPEESLYSGLCKLASVLRDIEGTVDEIRRDIRDLKDAANI